MNKPAWFAAIAVTVTAVLSPATAAAQPPPPAAPGDPWMIECYGQQVPLDPRLSVRNPLGGLMYRAMLEAMCADTSGPAPVVIR